MFRVLRFQVSGFRFQVSGFRFQGLGSGVWGAGCSVELLGNWESRIMGKGLRFRV